ncbi:hypothetical protein HDE_12108 [Halotydeus destructor]|nr:hypothetical protein HDE_12108 [Halotydeus destructor]
MQDVLMAKKVAIGVCVLSVSSLFFYNSHCLFSSFVNQERALSHAVEIVDRVYPPTVSICFPFAAILDKAKINANLDACRPAKYHNATKNDKLEFDLKCTEQIRLHFLTNTSMPSNKDVNTPDFDAYVLHVTYSFWDIVEKVKVLNDRRLVDYDRFNTSISELNITEKMLDEFKCFSVKILSPKGPIHYDKANLTYRRPC